MEEHRPLSDQPPDSAGRLLYRAFEEVGNHFDDLYAVYLYLYGDAPTYRSEITIDHADAFEYCKQRRYYTLICPYTDGRELLVERSFTDAELSWTLFGGSVRRDLAETFADAASRHAQRASTDLELGEIEPVAFFENRFIFNGDSHTHFGVGFIARIRNQSLAQKLRHAVSRAYLLDTARQLPQFSLNHNEEMAKLAAARIANLEFANSPEAEVAENLQYQSRYRVHGAIVKPVMQGASRFMFEHSLPDLNNEILARVLVEAQEGPFLDVACGENNLVYDIAASDKFSLVVGNDVSWSQIQLLASPRRNARLRDHPVLPLFTNHDARRLPFASKRFGVALCKNVLHHMDDLPSVHALLTELIRVSRVAIVVEVMDPAVEGRWGQLRHHYYMDFLKDAGRHFLSRREFAELTARSERETLFEMKTIRGVYQFAIFRQAEINGA